MSSNAEIVAAYYKVPGFVEFLDNHNFVRVTGENISKYYSLYQSKEMCRLKSCSDCGGLYVRWNSETDIHTGLLIHEKCAYRERENRDKLGQAFKKNFKVPKQFEEIEFADINIVESVKDLIKYYASNFPDMTPQGIYLHSTGKSFEKVALLWCLIRELVNNHKIMDGIVFHTRSIFIDKLNSDTFTPEHSFIKKVMSCDLLILSDFGTDLDSDKAVTKIEAIIEERTWNRMPVIITSVIPPEPWAWQSDREKRIFEKLMIAMKPICIPEEDELGI